MIGCCCCMYKCMCTNRFLVVVGKHKAPIFLFLLGLQILEVLKERGVDLDDFVAFLDLIGGDK